MCGIIGVSFSKSLNDPRLVKYAVDGFTESFIEASVRGIDASGVLVLNKGGDFYVYKAPMPSYDLVDTPEYAALMDKVGPSTIAIVGHTRAATTGSPQVNDNNHPIVSDPLVGVHNGVIWNHRDIRKLYGAVAEVDSSVILSVLADAMKDDLLTTKHMSKSLKQLEGSWAIAVADMRQDVLYVARNNTSPMFIGRSRQLKHMLPFGSTANIVNAGFPIHEATSMPPFTVMTMGRGHVHTTWKSLQIVERPVMRQVNPTYTKASKNAPTGFKTRHLEDWEIASGHVSGVNNQGYFSFFDEGAATAKALENAKYGRRNEYAR